MVNERNERSRGNTDATFQPKPGALRAPGQGGVEWIYANPHDRLYSTVSMIAVEYWDGEAWAPIEGDT